ncbi:hypothetical protein DP115_29660 [Brasilonema octagenarum UFV-OR1]|uniref:Uncharacterized protein n=1 Tax=Brasilonema octagenarum UFV-OR1 TaxID=417115 RepID=A0ABX1MH28_9CYAN|nr:hypothetical protein [Brasilonema octagenarum UFV-OR1]
MLSVKRDALSVVVVFPTSTSNFINKTEFLYHLYFQLVVANTSKLVLNYAKTAKKSNNPKLNIHKQTSKCCANKNKLSTQRENSGTEIYFYKD